MDQMSDLQMGQQSRSHSQSESIHGRGTNISQPNISTVVSASGDAMNVDSHYLLDAHDNVPMHGIVHRQHNRHMGAAYVYCPDMNPPSSTAVSGNRRTSNQLSGSNTFTASGTYKRKHSVGTRGNNQHLNASASSSIGPRNARHAENGIPLPSFSSSWSRSDEPLMVYDHNHSIQGNYSGQHFHPAPLPRLAQQLNSNNNNGHSLAWNQSLPMPFVQVPNANGRSLENTNMGLWRYHDTSGSTNGLRFPYPAPVNPHYHAFHYHTRPVQGRRGHSINFHPPVTAASYRVPTNPLSSAQIPIQNAFEMGSRRGLPVPPAGAWIHRPHRMTVRCPTLPPMAFLQVENIAILVGHHRDMRLDIEHMSYEELLALGERIGNANPSLSEETITNQMETRTYLLPTNLEEANSDEQEADICIICQDEYKNQDKIGILRCEHEYHADCLRNWLLVKNVCPICKSEALTP
ncbi:probable E3 ubiquitin-protein ligase ZFP1 [Abrus precatorius]|uniref:RING-type E3 ubiquitin transferase n=1 Tax=Abrus precatorius TaxID=3816 RepID=A0A8B8LIQ2_ABRPR|nr:probable E3 ubiquitin-protein ligase ZFP1 [Abrus precatorius]